MSHETGIPWYWQVLLNRKREIWEQASTQKLTAADEKALLTEYKLICEKLEPHLHAELEKKAIQFWLMGRQGSIEPDFEDLYKKKAELDRKFLGP